MISRIENVWLRRGLTVLAVVPVALASVIYGSAWGVWQQLREFPESVAEAWRGRP